MIAEWIDKSEGNYWIIMLSIVRVGPIRYIFIDGRKESKCMAFLQKDINGWQIQLNIVPPNPGGEKWSLQLIGAPENQAQPPYKPTTEPTAAVGNDPAAVPVPATVQEDCFIARPVKPQDPVPSSSLIRSYLHKRLSIAEAGKSHRLQQWVVHLIDGPFH